MNYFIYENWQAGPHKAVIHLGSCGYCKKTEKECVAELIPDSGGGMAHSTHFGVPA